MNRKLIKPDAAEDAEINRGIAADPDTMEMNDAQFADAAAAKRRRGRPVAARRKALISMRVDEDVLEAMRAQGDGWQTRANDALRRAFLPHPAARDLTVNVDGTIVVGAIPASPV